MRATLTTAPKAMAARTKTLRKVYSISLYAVDCLRIGMATTDEATRKSYLAACMESLADMQECIQGSFPNDKTLGD